MWAVLPFLIAAAPLEQVAVRSGVFTYPGVKGSAILDSGTAEKGPTDPFKVVAGSGWVKVDFGPRLVILYNILDIHVLEPVKKMGVWFHVQQTAPGFGLAPIEFNARLRNSLFPLWPHTYGPGLFKADLDSALAELEKDTANNKLKVETKGTPDHRFEIKMITYRRKQDRYKTEETWMIDTSESPSMTTPPGAMMWSRAQVDGSRSWAMAYTDWKTRPASEKEFAIPSNYRIQEVVSGKLVVKKGSPFKSRAQLDKWLKSLEPCNVGSAGRP